MPRMFLFPVLYCMARGQIDCNQFGSFLEHHVKQGQLSDLSDQICQLTAMETKQTDRARRPGLIYIYTVYFQYRLV